MQFSYVLAAEELANKTVMQIIDRPDFTKPYRLVDVPNTAVVAVNRQTGQETIVYVNFDHSRTVELLSKRVNVTYIENQLLPQIFNNLMTHPACQAIYGDVILTSAPNLQYQYGDFSNFHTGLLAESGIRTTKEGGYSLYFGFNSGVIIHLAKNIPTEQVGISPLSCLVATIASPFTEETYEMVIVAKSSFPLRGMFDAGFPGKDLLRREIAEQLINSFPYLADKMPDVATLADSIHFKPTQLEGGNILLGEF